MTQAIPGQLCAAIVIASIRSWSLRLMAVVVPPVASHDG